MEQATQRVKDYFRFCPGEEEITISNAVCFGRRRSSFHKCKGCQFNDDEKANRPTPSVPGTNPVPAQIEEQKRDEITSLFKAYDIRGVYPDPLDEKVAWRIGQAVAQFLRSELRGYDRSRLEKSAIVVGRDMRKSSVKLTESLIEGIRSAGSPVIEIGMIDTPQLYFAVNQLTCSGGVMVTASHNPARYNGFKICGEKGKPVSSETGLGKVLKIATHTSRNMGGKLAGLQHRELSKPYRTFVHGFLRSGPTRWSAEKPLKVVVDASNGMAGRWFPVLFGDVEWLSATRLNFEHNGEFVHDPNPLVVKNLAQVRDRVVRSKANLGVCFDGDADRCIFVDERGAVVRADWMTVLLARHLLKTDPGSIVLYDLRSSRVVPEEIRKAGGMPRRERCGHAFIKKSLSDAKGLFAGELSGHYYFRENAYCDSAMIAFCEVTNMLAEAGQPLSELVTPLRRYANSGELSFKNADAAQTIRKLSRKFNDAEMDYLDGITVHYRDWWFNVRASNTEPLIRLNMEAANRELLKAKLVEVVPLLGELVKK